MVTPSHLIRVWCSTYVGVFFLLLAQGQFSEANTIFFFCCSLRVWIFPPSGNSLSRSCPKPVFTHHQVDAHPCECFTTQISVSETCSLCASFFEDICKDVWASIRLIYWKCSQTLHGQGSWAWGTSNMVPASCSCESKRRLTASGSTSLCWKNNSSRSALCSFMSASRTTGVKTHLGTYTAYVDTCCSFPLTLRRLCSSPTNKLLQSLLWCYLLLSFKLPGLQTQPWLSSNSNNVETVMTCGVLGVLVPVNLSSGR